jgi:microcystin-dependent protein
MADSFTTDKVAALKMATGENENVWGSRLNNEAISPLSAAITNQVTKNVAGTSDVVLTAADCKNASIRLVGAISADISVIVVNGQGFYLIDNATSGNFQITVKTSAGTGIIVPQGFKMLVYCDGTNVVDGITALRNLRVTGNLSGITGTSQLSGFATTGLTIDGDDNTVTIKGSSTAGEEPEADDLAERELWVNTADRKFFTKQGSAIVDLTDIFPKGTVVPYAGASAPTGWLLCDGSAVSRTTYANLFDIIGTTYGTGDGSTTFNIPDLRGRVVAGKDNMGGTSANRLTGIGGSVDGDTLGAAGGEESHTLNQSEMPAHQHAVAPNAGAGSGFFVGVGSGGGASGNLTTAAGGGGAHNNVQPTAILNYIIKT